MGSKKTIEDCRQLAKARGGECLSEEYLNCKAKLKWICNYGHIWLTSYDTIRRGRWCPLCAQIRNNDSKRLSIDSCHALAQERGGFFLSNNYINSTTTKYLWKCQNNHTWYSTYGNIKNGNWCPYCANRVPITLNDAKLLANKRGGEFLSTEFNWSSDTYLWRCQCNYEWENSYSHIKKGQWCPRCAGKVITKEDCVKLAHCRGGNFLSAEYVNATFKYLWSCGKGHQWEASYHKVQQGRWCPICRNHMQTFIFNACKELFPEYDVKYNFKGFSWLKSKKGYKMEIDIFIPELKLAIEYDGEQHFRPVNFGGISNKKAEDCLEKQQELDRLKNKLLEQHPQDVNFFIRFNYTENINTEYIKNKIKEKLNNK